MAREWEEPITINLGTLAANTVSTFTANFSPTGDVQPNNSICLVGPPSITPLKVLVTGRVQQAGQLTLIVNNTTSQSINAGSQTFYVYVRMPQ